MISLNPRLAIKRLFLLTLVLPSLLGCNPWETKNKSDSSEANKAATVDDSKRPPLRVLLCSESEVADTIEKRWKSFSEQRLQIKLIGESELLDQTITSNADVIIAPSRNIPTLAENRYVTPIPDHLRSRSVVSDGESVGVDSPSNDPNWPPLWKRSVSYGQEMFAIPLGVRMMAMCKVDTAIDKDLVIDKKPVLNDSEQSDWLVDRFLAYAADRNPTDSDLSILFKLDDGRSRLADKWLAEALTDFVTATKNISIGNQSPSAAWTSVRRGEVDQIYAWPGSPATEQIDNDHRITVSPPKSWLDPGRSLAIMIAKSNRQSAPSARLIQWLDHDDQRSVLSALTDQIDVVPDRWPSVSKDEGLDRYRKLLRTALSNRFVGIELRFPDANAYRNDLELAITKVFEGKATADEALQECDRSWEQRTQSIGKTKQEERIQRSLELMKF